MESVYFGCFLFGFLTVVASALLGFAHTALPGLEGIFHAEHGGAHAGTDSAGHGTGHNGFPLWNVSSLLAFLMWFGAAGYAAMDWFGLSAWLAAIPALAVGVVGGALISWFLRLVMRGETVMNPAEYRMEGTLARVTISIPHEGTGEIVFSKGNSRRSEGARSIDGRPIARGEEVVVVDYQRGIALVQSWEDFKSDT